MIKSLLAFALALTAISAQAKPLRTFTLHLEQSPSLVYVNDVRVGVQDPDQTPIGDILYFHGFADRLDNHAPLFEEWNKKGFRVIAFDMPSHGKTVGTTLNLFTFSRLEEMARQVESATREEATRPLLLAGWSTGGLLAVRIVQSETGVPELGRPIAGMILFAPGISVYTQVGEPSLRYPFGQVTNRTLTHDPNPPHMGLPRPKSPGSDLEFAVALKINSLLSQHENYPANLPTLVMMSEGTDDVYADSAVLADWIRAQNQNGADIKSIAYFGARHEIDNETEDFGGPQSRRLAADFAAGVLRPSFR
jgi:alpha-beta hydrolase superfamily lysophospholipase